MTTSQKSDFISRTRQDAANKLLAAREAIAALVEVDAQTGIFNSLQDADFQGSNAGITAAEFKDAGLALASINTTLKAGAQPTALAKIMKIQGG